MAKVSIVSLLQLDVANTIVSKNDETHTCFHICSSKSQDTVILNMNE